MKTKTEQSSFFCVEVKREGEWLEMPGFREPTQEAAESGALRLHGHPFPARVVKAVVVLTNTEEIVWEGK